MLTTKKPSQFSPLALAYIGDGVYELFVRTRIIEEHENLPANKLLIGFLYLSGETERLDTLMNIAYENEVDNN